MTVDVVFRRGQSATYASVQGETFCFFVFWAEHIIVVHLFKTKASKQANKHTYKQANKQSFVTVNKHSLTHLYILLDVMMIIFK